MVVGLWLHLLTILRPRRRCPLPPHSSTAGGGEAGGRRPRRRSWPTACLALMLAGLAGCAVGPDFVRPTPPDVAQYTQGQEPDQTISAAGQAQQFAYGETIAQDWWQEFQAPALHELIQTALNRNPTLAAAEARLRQSQALLRAGYGVFFPQASASLDVVRQKFSPVQFGGTSTGSTFNLYTPQVSAGYLLDLFGGQRRTVEGLAAQVDYQEYLARGTYLTLIGNIINTAVAQAAYQAQIEATEQIIAAIKEQVQLTETQAQAGLVAQTSVTSLRTQLASMEASLPPLQQNLQKTNHLLAVLLGYPPGAWTPPRLRLDEIRLPRTLPVTLPGELVRRRPDILAAEAQLHRASAQIGVATAALFPSVTLSANLGKNITDLSEIFGAVGQFWKIGANLTQPLFRGGSLWYQRRAAQEAYQAALGDYQQVVLTAFQQVADSLRALENDAKTLQAQTEALQNASQTLSLVQANHQAGLVNYLQVLIANAQYHQARLGAIQAQAQRLQDSAALFVALGGSWRPVPHSPRP